MMCIYVSALVLLSAIGCTASAACAIDEEVVSSAAPSSTSDDPPPPPPQVNGYPASLDSLADDCIAYAPDEEESGGYARIVLGPFKTDWKSAGYRMLVADDDEHAVPKNWWIGVARVAPGEDPNATECAPKSAGFSYSVVEEEPGYKVIDSPLIALDPVPYYAGESLVVCAELLHEVSNTDKPSAIVACGGPGSCSSRDQWEEEGDIATMYDHAPAPQCRKWVIQAMVSCEETGKCDAGTCVKGVCEL